MGLESASYVQDLVSTNPLNTDKRERGDDHLRLIKTAVKASLPEDLRNVSAAAVGDILQFTAANGGGFANVRPGSIFNEICVYKQIATPTANTTYTILFDTLLKDTTGTVALPDDTIVTPWTNVANTSYTELMANIQAVIGGLTDFGFISYGVSGEQGKMVSDGAFGAQRTIIRPYSAAGPNTSYSVEVTTDNDPPDYIEVYLRLRQY